MGKGEKAICPLRTLIVIRDQVSRDVLFMSRDDLLMSRDFCLCHAIFVCERKVYSIGESLA